MSDETTTMSSSERRERTWNSAREQFALHGYKRTTTHQIARAAGVSQPYVVRAFGSKEKLFVDILNTTVTELTSGSILRATVAAVVSKEPGRPRPSLGTKAQRSFPFLLQAFLAGGDPVVGREARAGFLRLYGFLVHEVGLVHEQATDVLGVGLLFSVIHILDVPPPGEIQHAGGAEQIR